MCYVLCLQSLLGFEVNLTADGGVVTMSRPNRAFGAQRVAVGTRSLCLKTALCFVSQVAQLF